MRLASSDVAGLAARLGIATLKPPSLRDDELAERVRAAQADAMVVAAYGLILPAAMLAIPRLGCLNVHASLLPRWRGAAPIERALLAGDDTTGVSIMQMDAGLDTGPVLLEAPYAVAPRETGGSLTQALAERGAEAIVRALRSIDSLPRVPQNESRASYAPKLVKADSRIDWGASNVINDRKVRAFNPAPGAETALGDTIVKIWEALPVAGSGVCGEILGSGSGEVVVACGAGALRLIRAQRAGGRPMSAEALLRGARLAPGARFGATSLA